MILKQNGLKKTELDWDIYPELIQFCQTKGVNFLTTCFSLKYVSFLSSLGMKEIKAASPDLLNFKMIEALAKNFSHLIISTGMHTLSEIEKAIKFINDNKVNVTLLHSVSLYPTPLDKAWMDKFLWLKTIYPKVGYSDHTVGIEVVKFAMANQALIIEKHFKLGEDGPGRACSWDATPGEITNLVDYRNKLISMSEPEINDSLNSWLDQEEIKSRKRFLNRWK